MTFGHGVRNLIGAALLALIAAACGGNQAVITRDAQAESAKGDATSLQDDGEFRSIRYRLLAEGRDVGSPWTTARLTADELWAVAPDAEIDEENEIFFRFTLAESSSCPFGNLVDLEFFAGDARLYPVMETVDQDGDCTDDENTHAIIVAVARQDLPSGGFSLWVERNDPPEGLDDGQTLFAPGELREPPHDLSEFPALTSSGDLEVGETRIIYSASTHCGLDRIWYTIAGSQWMFEDGLLGGGHVPSEWESFERGENIDLQVTRTEEQLLAVSALGSAHTEAYIPVPLGEEQGCD